MTGKGATLSRCRQLLSEGADIERILTDMRVSGYSKSESIKALVDLNVGSLRRAKEIVHYSKTWDDTRERDEAFHEVVVKSAQQKHGD